MSARTAALKISHNRRISGTVMASSVQLRFRIALTAADHSREEVRRAAHEFLLALARELVRYAARLNDNAS
jgi:hypothetical protein